MRCNETWAIQGQMTISVVLLCAPPARPTRPLLPAAERREWGDTPGGESHRSRQHTGRASHSRSLATLAGDAPILACPSLQPWLLAFAPVSMRPVWLYPFSEGFQGGGGGSPGCRFRVSGSSTQGCPTSSSNSQICVMK